METLQIELLNPKAKGLLKDLADLNLISIRKTSSSAKKFLSLLKKLRKNGSGSLSLEEITKEVEAVRQKRNEQ